MLEQITITEKSGWTRYAGKDTKDTPEAIASGVYFVRRGWMTAEYREQFKQQLAPLAANDPAGRFAWLLPAERWVKTLLDGFLPPELTMYGLVEDCPDNRTAAEETLNLPAGLLSNCRTWQQQFVFDYLYCKSKGWQYRRAAIVRVGGGKTLTSLMIAQDHESPLVLAPSYVHDDWRREAAKWGLKCPRLSTYESASKHGGSADALFIDEALLGANPNTRRHGDALGVSRQARTVVGLTGTPQSTGPMDLRWLRVVQPGCVPAEEKPWRYLFGTDTELVEVKPGQKAYVTKTWDQEKVSKFVSPYVMMVNPAEIVAELPEITFSRIYVDAPPKYKLVLKGAATNKSKSKALAQARMCTDGGLTDDAGQVLAHLSTAKLDAVEQFVQNLGEPVIIAARWDYMVNDLAERLFTYKPAVLKGGADYTAELSRFRSSETSVLIVNAQISQGMNLQEQASCLVFCSNSLKPTDREQLIGRIYRPGQKRGVRVFDIVARETLDEVALNLLEKHQDRSEAYLEAALRREWERLAQ
jgi:hypothetical protein